MQIFLHVIRYDQRTYANASPVFPVFGLLQWTDDWTITQLLSGIGISQESYKRKNEVGEVSRASIGQLREKKTNKGEYFSLYKIKVMLGN